MNEYMTAEEVAERLRIKKGTLANWRNQRVGPGFMKFGTRVLYPRADVEAWEKAHRVETTP